MTTNVIPITAATRKYLRMSVAEIEAIITAILRTATSDAGIEQRVRDELGYKSHILCYCSGWASACNILVGEEIVDVLVRSNDRDFDFAAES